MSDEITADWGTLMNQSASTASVWLEKCFDAVDGLDPNDEVSIKDKLSMAVDLARVAAMDFQASALGVAAEKISQAIEAIYIPETDLKPVRDVIAEVGDALYRK